MPTQVLVVGGGINGASVFRDLSLQGVDVILVERGDISAGASAASSHMVHGGLRYLENGEMRLVQESVRERNSLLYTAPHQVAPLPTTIPLRRAWPGLLSAPLRVITHRRGRGRRERGALLAKLGLTLYDSYSGSGRRMPRHEFAGPAAVRERFPNMDPGIRYAATYFDASVGQPERIALELVLDGAEANPGSAAYTYTEAVGASPDGVRVRDLITGEEAVVQAEVVINASGPWTDLTNAALGTPSAFMGGTQGSHIVVDNPALLDATGGHEIFFEHADGRIVLIYPLHGRVMIGTTDTPADPRGPVRCSEDDVDYFIDLVGHVFPDIPVERDQIVYRFAGIRPLPRTDGAAPGELSRDYRLEQRQDSAGRLRIDIVGGKWTTFRALGERVTDVVLEHRGEVRRRHTLHEPIGGGKRYPRTGDDREAWMSERLGDLADGRRRVLFARYGTRAEDVAAHLRAGHDTPIAGDRLSVREVDFMVRHEHALRVTDVVQRRTALAFAGAVSRGVIEQVAGAMAGTLGWDDARVDEEIDACVATLIDQHGARLAQDCA
ncbi:glycerol-3-phosphate dehydrogenase/oxidase [uncultured Demequina sp.]|uniref:glycerol-3-phosphate dehydrogenase/oxidase n=1 Tax=uncultured Demequina sp. TaxID=693499 RepID=UPI0025E32968|nr:glycerol-3-phosphate dehydrogenase/oxidase [uncultured Demequina sp.]